MKEENSLDDSGGAVTKRRVTTTTLSTIVRTVGEGDGIRALAWSERPCSPLFQNVFALFWIQNRSKSKIASDTSCTHAIVGSYHKDFVSVRGLNLNNFLAKSSSRSRIWRETDDRLDRRSINFQLTRGNDYLRKVTRGIGE